MKVKLFLKSGHVVECECEKMSFDKQNGEIFKMSWESAIPSSGPKLDFINTSEIVAITSKE